MCMGCGLVLDAVLGGGDGGPGVIRRTKDRSRDKEREERRGEEEEEEEAAAGEAGLWPIFPVGTRKEEEENWKRRGRERIFEILTQFHLDTEAVGEKVWRKYSRLYEKRRREKSLHGSENREKAALVFAIASTLNEERIPRPVGQIASVCGFPRRHLRRLLKIEKTLQLEKGRRVEFASANAVDYVNALCAHLDIPFSVGLQAERILEDEDLKWALFGHRPQHFAAAAIEGVLKARGMPSKQKELCRELGCGKTSIKRLVQKIPRRMFCT